MKKKTRVLSFKIKGNEKVEIAHFLSNFEDICFDISEDTLKVVVLDPNNLKDIAYSIKSFLEELKEKELKEKKGFYTYSLDSISKISSVTVPVKLLKSVIDDKGYFFEVDKDKVISTANVSTVAEIAGEVSCLLKDLTGVSKPVKEIIVRVAIESDMLSSELLNEGIEKKIFKDKETVSLNISYDDALSYLRDYVGD